MTRLPVILLSAFLAACGAMTDAATRLGSQDGATYTVRHETPSRRGECEGPYKVQFDRVGALIIWCWDADGQSAGSPGTSYHRRLLKCLHCPDVATGLQQVGRERPLASRTVI